MSFTYRKRICLKETDATGVIYFSEQLNMASEAFEAFLTQEGFRLSEMIATMDFLMPIVHVEANYSSPMRVGDEIEIVLNLTKLGDRSFSLKSLFSDLNGKTLGDVLIVHATISKETFIAVPIPSIINKCLNKLHLNELVY